jgi:AcrR family transcriptional regulator
MPAKRQPVEEKRRIPRQARAEETVTTILEGAAQILEAGGLAAFTTNAVAERAGVSIGTLYQYFADKNALIRALAERELQATLARVRQALLGEIDPTAEGRVRVMIRAMITAFRGRQRARKAVLQALLSRGGGVELMAPVAAFLAETEARIGQQPQRVFATLDSRQLFVLSRALMGAIRAAVLEEQPLLRSPEFEDELVRLMMAYLRAVSPAA